MPPQIATDEVAKSANRSGIAFALDEYEGADRWRGCHASSATILLADFGDDAALQCIREE
jgi:hypothetical protein